MVSQAQTPISDDPFESANQAKERPAGPRTYFGQMRVDVWYCALVKGQGKVPFDPGQYSQDQRCTAIDLALSAIGNNRSYEVKRELIAESRDWARIVKPSLVALAIDLRGLNDRWVQAELVPTGQTYIDKEGIKKDRTTLKFLAVYQDENECRVGMGQYFAAIKAAGEAAHGPQAEFEAATQAPAPKPANGNGTAAPDPERATAAKFLPSLWASAKAGGDGAITRFGEMLAKNPVLSKHFTMDSAEVQALVLAG